MPVEEWPERSAREVAANAKEGIDQLQRKTFSAVVTRAQGKRKQSDTEQNNPAKISVKNRKTSIPRPPAGSTIKKLTDVRKFSSLIKLIRVTAWVW